MMNYDVIVIGGGPAGLAAAISAKGHGANVLLIEREARLGGILKQCIHDGFGVIRFKEKLSGPEYAKRYIDLFKNASIDYQLLTFVTDIEKSSNGFFLSVVNRTGVHTYQSNAIILATGCRERTSKQVFIHGTRPAGIFTAGCAQHYTNILGQLPTKRCVILGSGDIGLIMARRLTLEGATVCGVYEAKSTPSGLMRNIIQCLEDYNIPLYLSHTVTRVYGEDRVTAVEISEVDEQMKPIKGTSKKVECDALIVSVGLIPENELAQRLHVAIDPRTRGPNCNTEFMTSVDGIFSCGNALHVNDLVDYVSESGEYAGKAAACYKKTDRQEVECLISPEFLYLVPQRISLKQTDLKPIFYFRSMKNIKDATLSLNIDGTTVFTKEYTMLNPPNMERIELDLKFDLIHADSKIEFQLEGECIQP